MIDDIGYSIVLLSRVIGLPATGQLETQKVNFIETIRKRKIPIDWDTILHDNMDEKLLAIKNNLGFYMTP